MSVFIYLKLNFCPSDSLTFDWDINWPTPMNYGQVYLEHKGYFPKSSSEIHVSQYIVVWSTVRTFDIHIVPTATRFLYALLMWNLLYNRLRKLTVLYFLYNFWGQALHL